MGALVFGVHFALEQDDLTGAKTYATRLAQVAPAHPLVPAFFEILRLRDTLAAHPPPSVFAACCDSLARKYNAIGLSEDAVDFSLRSIAAGSDDEGLYLALADTYVSKKRFWPARYVLSLLISRHPENAGARDRLTGLSRLF